MLSFYKLQVVYFFCVNFSLEFIVTGIFNYNHLNFLFRRLWSPMRSGEVYCSGCLVLLDKSWYILLKNLRSSVICEVILKYGYTNKSAKFCDPREVVLKWVLLTNLQNSSEYSVLKNLVFFKKFFLVPIEWALKISALEFGNLQLMSSRKSVSFKLNTIF